ncbi:MAG TPA: hypothetical protein VKC59_03700 [Candidatus Limnocylindrales bacterium]|nr:hypothetical protein [Candidatus Limnocylindrales bacterium]
MSPLVPLIAGAIALAVGVAVLRSYGPNYRIGRLLASTPKVSVAEARELAVGRPQYVAIHGRIDSETDFEDAAHRPLVFRRTRLQFRRGTAWTDLDDRRERVPFEVRDGLDAIAVDDSALDLGLVVIVRESDGTAADIADRLPDGVPFDAPARLRIEQISSVEHAIVVGVPALDDQGSPMISSGLGRPLVLTTLDRGEAMRILAHGESGRPMVALAALAGGLALVAVGLAWATIAAWT